MAKIIANKVILPSQYPQCWVTDVAGHDLKFNLPESAQAAAAAKLALEMMYHDGVSDSSGK